MENENTGEPSLPSLSFAPNLSGWSCFIKRLLLTGTIWGGSRSVVMCMTTLISVTLCMLLKCDIRTTTQQCYHLSGLSYPSWFNFKFNPVLMKQVIYLCLVLSLRLSNLAAQAYLSYLPSKHGKFHWHCHIKIFYIVKTIYVPLFKTMQWGTLQCA